jgi:hypothetical protein
MAHATITTDFYPKDRVLARFGAWVLSKLDTIAENNPRLKKARHLQGLSDAELAALGIQRDNIVRIAFADVYHR